MSSQHRRTYSRFAKIHLHCNQRRKQRGCVCIDCATDETKRRLCVGDLLTKMYLAPPWKGGDKPQRKNKISIVLSNDVEGTLKIDLRLDLKSATEDAEEINYSARKSSFIVSIFFANNRMMHAQWSSQSSESPFSIHYLSKEEEEEKKKREWLLLFFVVFLNRREAILTIRCWDNTFMAKKTSKGEALTPPPLFQNEVLWY